MKTKKIRLFSFVLCLMMLCASIPAYASSFDERTTKMLYVVDDELYDSFIEELNNPTIIIDASKDIEYYEDVDISESIMVDFSLFDYVSSDNVTMDMISNYKGVALPASAEYAQSYATSAYNAGVIVYLYGDLTIDNYKDIVGIEDFSITTNAYNSSETKTTEVKQEFDSEFEATEKYNVISYGNNSLLCKFGNASKSVNYMVAAAKNCADTVVNSNARATIVKSEFDFVTYWGTNNAFSVHMDYTLYREMDETDSTYDYFAIKTRTWVESGSGEVTGIKTKYELPYASDNLLETGPDSQNNIGTLSVSCGYGDGGLNASIGYSIDMSDNRPTIERTEDYSADTVEWLLRSRTWFPKNIDDADLVCVATWASTGKLAAINVSYQGVVNIGPNSQYPTTAGYTTVPITFSYSD